MPTFTSIALESLIEPRFRDSYRDSAKKSEKLPAKKSEKGDGKEVGEVEVRKPSRHRVNISPALYITPEPTPIVYSSSDSLSPSPYVANRKGRGGLRRRSEVRKEEVEARGGDMGHMAVEDGVESVKGEEREVVEESEDFVDTRCDSLSVGSSSDVRELGSVSGWNPIEFYDADDDFSHDGSVSSTLHSCHSFESEMRATRLSLLDEIGRRKIAEDALGLVYNQWQGVADVLLARAGIRYPAPSVDMQFEIGPIEQFCQEIVVNRFVSEAIGQALARAEAEIAAEDILKAKDQEISRLKDRLQYYEAVNHEMSQRNQEVIEVARKQRKKRKTLQKWLWGGLGLSIAIGASVVAYSCHQHTSEIEPLLSSSDSSSATGISSSESA
ncbi:hypothetical protein DCAR_0934525 [Daucus carota subsp. sativus]|uniref:Uncharacterized protein n=1 Tax=Daucus carota subsp. sativus TaxID=79200 RepID=A0A175YF54_DAUCS|nr:PREDICTED: uncharacterized protein LOC108200304 [Daucus carota subsp. sativus]WOH14995.1 hypothetical protein DCAR_0934525 [Daucus carota subsp. sativus]